MKTIFTAMALLAATPALAEGTFTVGGFAAHSSGEYKGDDDWGIAPYLSYDSEQFHVGLDGLAYHVMNNDQTTVSVALQSNFGLVFDKDNKFFKGMDRDADAMLGLSFSHDFDGFFVEGEASKDVSEAHGGVMATAAVGYEADLGFASLSLSGGATYTSKDYNQYYYGVTAKEARADRAQYNPDDAVMPFAEIGMTIPISERAAVIGSVNYTSMDDLKDSPLLEDDHVTTTAIGIVYQF